MVVLIFGIIWLIKGEIKIRQTRWWDERRIDASLGRTLGAIMVIGSLLPLFIPFPSQVTGICGWILAILPIVVGIVFSEKMVRSEPDYERTWLWQARLAETDSERVMWYRKVLTINPDNEEAKSKLAALQSRNSPD